MSPEELSFIQDESETLQQSSEETSVLTFNDKTLNSFSYQALLA